MPVFDAYCRGEGVIMALMQELVLEQDFQVIEPSHSDVKRGKRIVT